MFLQCRLTEVQGGLHYHDPDQRRHRVPERRSLQTRLPLSGFYETLLAVGVLRCVFFFCICLHLLLKSRDSVPLKLFHDVLPSLSHLLPTPRTGVLPDSAEPDSNPPEANFSVDPLDEFSSWYPPAWCWASEQDYSLVDVPTGTLAYKRVQEFFNESMPETKVDIISIQQVQNLFHWDKYQRSS